jgi:AhpD family alkylhydroperoxidase
MDNMQRIKAIDTGTAKGKAKELLDAVEKKYGGVPNSFKTMAHSPAGLQGFLDLSGTLEGGVLPFETRYQIALAVSEINGCPYCLSAFTAIGKGNGMKDETLAMCRLAGSTDPKIDAILKFAAAIVRERGAVSRRECNLNRIGRPGRARQFCTDSKTAVPPPFATFDSRRF